MLSASVDASLFAIPPPAASSEQLRSYVENLGSWSEFARDFEIELYISGQAATVLFEANVYPLRAVLADRFRSLGIEEYDANTVVAIVDRMFQQCREFEVVFGLQDVLFTDLRLEPNGLGGLHPVVAGEARRSAVLICILRQCCADGRRGHSLVVGIPVEGNVHLEAVVEMLEHERDDLGGLPNLPGRLIGELLFWYDPENALLGLSEVELWSEAADERDLVLAIHVALLKSRRASGREVREMDFVFGREFFQSAKACVAGHGPALIPRILRAVVETVDRIDLPAIHWLRTGAGGNDPQVTRGSDKAWRRSIDNEYRLHYWLSSADRIEFGCVSVHNNFTIPR